MLVTILPGVFLCSDNQSKSFASWKLVHEQKSSYPIHEIVSSYSPSAFHPFLTNFGMHVALVTPLYMSDLYLFLMFISFRSYVSFSSSLTLLIVASLYINDKLYSSNENKNVDILHVGCCSIMY